MKDAKITQTEAKAQDGFLASLHSLITHVKSKKSTITRKNKGSVKANRKCQVFGKLKMSVN